MVLRHSALPSQSRSAISSPRRRTSSHSSACVRPSLPALLLHPAVRRPSSSITPSRFTFIYDMVSFNMYFALALALAGSAFAAPAPISGQLEKRIDHSGRVRVELFFRQLHQTYIIVGRERSSTSVLALAARSTRTATTSSPSRRVGSRQPKEATVTRSAGKRSQHNTCRMPDHAIHPCTSSCKLLIRRTARRRSVSCATPARDAVTATSVSSPLTLTAMK